MSAEHDPIAVEVSDTQAHVALDRRRLAEVARHVLILHRIDRAAISLAIVNDAAIRRVHADHLADDTPTDVITFDLSEPGSGCLSAELVISAETAARAAAARNIAPVDEVLLYLVHGLLHLCGYDDLDDPSRDAMRIREREVMAELGLRHPGV